ncbi:secreted protein [sediment metagenome]|uniref:Secreted protein n=1 Tax=sediment metagenome TaxID=749907 RepID=D9PLV4_9ZZZZ
MKNVIFFTSLIVLSSLLLASSPTYASHGEHETGYSGSWKHMSQDGKGKHMKQNGKGKEL